MEANIIFLKSLLQLHLPAFCFDIIKSTYRVSLFSNVNAKYYPEVFENP